MGKAIGATSLTLRNLIMDLKKLSTKENVNVWKRISNDLKKPARIRSAVNLGTIQKTIRDGEVALVPGKVLSEGELTKKVTVAAYQFSKVAESKINKVGKAVSIKQLMKDNPKGKKVRIFG